jgi:peptidoglycan hydrolase CwlO-like protein
LAGAVLSAIGLLASTAPAGAQSTQTQLDAARRRARGIQGDLERIADGFADADAQQHITEDRVNETIASINRTKDDIGGLQDKLKDRVRTAYRQRGIGFFQLLLEARSFRDFNLRLMSLQRQTLADEDLILKLRKKRSELDLKQRDLEAQSAVLQQRKEAYAAQARRATITLQQANRLVDELQGRRCCKRSTCSRRARRVSARTSCIAFSGSRTRVHGSSFTVSARQ